MVQVIFSNMRPKEPKHNMSDLIFWHLMTTSNSHTQMSLCPRYQQVVFPLCTEIQLGVIAQFGFKPDGEGIIQFTQVAIIRWLGLLVSPKN